MEFRYCVIADGRRDHYQVQLARHEGGALAVGITDFYTPDWLAALVSALGTSRLSRLQLRHCPGLSSRKMIDLFPRYQARSYYLRRQGSPPQRLYELRDQMMARELVRYTRSRADLGLVCYSYQWPAVSSKGRAWGGPTFIFQVHPLATQIRQVLREDRVRTGLTYSPEPEELTPEDDERRYLESLGEVDGIIAASSFTKSGLVAAGVPASKIAVAPYGGAFDVSSRLEAGADKRWENQRPLRLLWVGQLAYRKALHHLLDAIRPLGRDVHLDVVTRNMPDAELVDRMLPNVTFHHSVDQLRLRQFYLSHHLFALPSLAEGFGLVYLEAMAQGLPILCASNTGGPDVIQDGVEGFVVPPGDPTPIRQAIECCLADPDLLPRMSSAALAGARKWSWARFRTAIRHHVANFEQGWKQ